MQNVITMCEVGTYDGYGWILERKRPDKPVRGVDQYIFFVRLSVANQICGHDVSAPASSNIETLKEIVEFAFETRTELFASIPIGFQQVNGLEVLSHRRLIEIMSKEFDVVYGHLEVM
jgi:hypothetical protein